MDKENILGESSQEVSLLFGAGIYQNGTRPRKVDTNMKERAISDQLEDPPSSPHVFASRVTTEEDTEKVKESEAAVENDPGNVYTKDMVEDLLAEGDISKECCNTVFDTLQADFSSSAPRDVLDVTCTNPSSNGYSSDKILTEDTCKKSMSGDDHSHLSLSNEPIENPYDSITFLNVADTLRDIQEDVCQPVACGTELFARGDTPAPLLDYCPEREMPGALVDREPSCIKAGEDPSDLSPVVTDMFRNIPDCENTTSLSSHVQFNGEDDASSFYSFPDNCDIVGLSEVSAVVSETIKNISDAASFYDNHVDDDTSIISSSEQPGIGGPTTEPSDDITKVVTFAEGKEIFDMSLKLPAPITVHLDTPVSFISPDDVLDISQISLEPTIDIQPTVSIVNKEDRDDPAAFLGDGNRGGKIVCGDNNNIGLRPDNGDVKHTDESSTMIVESSETAQALNARISREEENEMAFSPEEMGEPVNPDKEQVVTSTQGEGLSDNHAGKEEEADDDGRHKEFIVENVAESDLSGKHYNIKFEPPTPIGTDGGSHSTETNDHDTIGPLDNLQFLKTLNYTASQAFDQDDHFGLNFVGPDGRSLVCLQEPADLDGGWAWVVLIASFLATTLLGACVYTAGILMGAILEQVENDLTKASWVGSVFVCTMSLSGPFVGSVLSRYGARLTVSCAGIVITMGFIGASLSNTIVQLILTHGFLAGLGAGFTLNPVFVTAGQYFNKYRGFACGILAMGAGAGMLTGGAFVSYLLTLFDLRGTYLIWAGVMLHVTPIGLLLLPSPEERMRKLEKEISIGEFKSHPDKGSMNSGPNSRMNSLYGSANQSMLSGIDRISIGPHGHRVYVPGSLVSQRPSKLQVNSGEAEMPLLKAALHNEMSRSSHSVNRPGAHTKSSLNTSSSDIYGLISPVVGIGQHARILEGRERSLSSNMSPSLNMLNTTPPSNPINVASNKQYLPTNAPHYASSGHISGRFSSRSLVASTAPRGELDNESMTSTFVSSLRPRDVLSPRHPVNSRSISSLMGSVASFPTALAIVQDDLKRLEPSSPYSGSLKGYLIAVLDSIRILRNVPFCIFVATNFLWALGESPVLIHLPSYVISLGTSAMEASSLYTSMGIASMSGRFLSGLIATDVNIGPVLLHTGSLGVAGMVVCLSPLITSTYPQQVIFSFLVGIYTGALVPLTSLITIELLGIGELSLGFGLISMSQGFGYLIGPPLSSVLVKSIGFVNAFVCSGLVLLSGSMLALSMTFVLSSSDDDDEMGIRGTGEGAEDTHSLGDLEKVLQKLAADSESEDHDDESGMFLDESASQSGQVDLSSGTVVDSQKPIFGSGPIVDYVVTIDGESSLAVAKDDVTKPWGSDGGDDFTPCAPDRLDTILEVA